MGGLLCQNGNGIQVGTNSISFGVAGPVLAWQRPMQSGKARFRPPEQKTYQEMVGMIGKVALTKAKIKRLECPVALGVRVFYPKPKIFKGGDMWKTSKPDLDNIIKNIKDSLNKIVWADDAQVVKYLTCFKKYAAGPTEIDYALVDIEWGFAV
jgi:Holliday junction resolvase RusA-like endonuclease